MTITDPDDDEDDLCTILIGVLQKDRRKKRKEGLDMLTIGYVIYKVNKTSFIPMVNRSLVYVMVVMSCPINGIIHPPIIFMVSRIMLKEFSNNFPFFNHKILVQFDPG